MSWLKMLIDWIRGRSRGGFVPLDKEVKTLAPGRIGHMARCHFCRTLIKVWDVWPPDDAAYVCAACCEERNL